MLPATRESNNVYSYPGREYETASPLPVKGHQAPEQARISIWDLVRNHWILLGVAMVACGGAAYCASLWMTPVYRAAAQIEIGDPSDDALSQNHTRQEEMPGDSYFQTQIEILSSRTLLARVSDRLHLEQRFQDSVKPAGWSGWLSVLRPHTDPIPPRDQALAALREHLEILPPRGVSRLITVQFDAEDRNLAAEVPNAIGDEFIKQDLELRQKSNSHTSEWLSGELEGLRARLRDSEQALQAYTQSAGLMSIDPDQETVAQARLRQLQDDLSKAQGDRISKEAFDNLARKSDPTTAAALLDSGPLRDYSVKLADAEQQLAKLQAIFTPNHYKVKQAEAEIESIRLAMDGERRNVLSRATNSYQAAALREKMLTSAFESQTATVSAQDARTARYTLLKREVESNRQIYDTILQKVKSVQVDASLRPDNILIVDAAEPPTQPYKPNPELNAGAGATAGLLLSGVFALVLARRDRRFRTPEAAVQYLNVPELGVIPSLDSEKPLRPSTFLTLRRGEEREDVDLIKLTGAPSAITDSFRAAVASVLFACAGRRGSLALTVTSAAAKEGKTTVTASLAVVLAQMKHRVLVIDGDVRKPRLHALFGLENQKGLTDLLAETRAWEKGIWTEYVKPTAFPNLSVITSGRSAAPHVEILDGPKIEKLVALVRSNFDMVLIDTPPVLDLADARIFSRLSDGVIVVCKASATDPDAARGATRRLQNDGSNILGTILTDMPGGTPNYNGSYYYRDGTGKPSAVGSTANKEAV